MLLVASKVPERLRNQLGIAIAKRTYKAASALLSSSRWQRVYNLGVVRNGCCGQVPGPKIPRPLTSSMSRPWLRLSR